MKDLKELKEKVLKIFEEYEKEENNVEEQVKEWWNSPKNGMMIGWSYNGWNVLKNAAKDYQMYIVERTIEKVIEMNAVDKYFQAYNPIFKLANNKASSQKPMNPHIPIPKSIQTTPKKFILAFYMMLLCILIIVKNQGYFYQLKLFLTGVRLSGSRTGLPPVSAER